MDKLQWLDLPVDVIEKQLNYLSLDDIINLTEIKNKLLYSTILSYIRNKILSIEYDLEDIIKIRSIDNTFKMLVDELVPIDYTMYTHFALFNVFEKNNLFVNMKCTKLIEYLYSLDNEKIKVLGNHNIDYVNSIVRYTETPIYNYNIYGKNKIIDNDYTDDIIEHFDRHKENRYFYIQLFKGRKRLVKDRYYVRFSRNEFKSFWFKDDDEEEYSKYLFEDEEDDPDEYEEEYRYYD
jgi:hypothetical protein